jgi:hypothetical protein
MQRYNKSYQEPEYDYRLAVYLQNKAFIEQHNASESTFTLAINKFADLTEDEFDSIFTAKNTQPEKLMANVVSDGNYQTLPESYDWRNYNMVTSVKD